MGLRIRCVLLLLGKVGKSATYLCGICIRRCRKCSCTHIKTASFVFYGLVGLMNAKLCWLPEVDNLRIRSSVGSLKRWNVRHVDQFLPGRS